MTAYRSGPAYARAGVDLDASEAIKGGIRDVVEATRTDLVRTSFGSFGGAFGLPSGYAEPVLVTSIDGVGTKLHLALAWGRPEAAGRDLVNHCINDIAVLNARPIAFLDYVASGALDAGTVRALVAGMAEAARAADVAIVGGETAQMPGTYLAGSYDLVGSIVGVVERSAMPDAESVRGGDTILGLPSLGLHTNGYSLARTVAEALGPDHPVDGVSLADALLAAHPSYLAELQAAFAIEGVRVAAHITGGGLDGNVPRVLPAHLAARFEVGSWPVPPVFDLIRTQAGVTDEEMYRVFNMGLGMVIVTSTASADRVMRAVPGAMVVGEVVDRAAGAVLLEGL